MKMQTAKVSMAVKSQSIKMSRHDNLKVEKMERLKHEEYADRMPKKSSEKAKRKGRQKNRLALLKELTR